MRAGLEKKVGRFIKSEGLFDSGGKVLLAVSGGADSTALLYVMCALRAEGQLDPELVCAHINHQLRGVEADEDERFVRGQCEELEMPFVTRRIDVRGFARRNKLSTETAARKLRHEALLDTAKGSGCDCIAMAHQKDDNAETLVQRLARGTGFRGLGGIWPVRVFDGGIRIVRPMLCVVRGEVEQYLNGRGIEWRRDRTNEDVSFRRNFIRHRLLPELQKTCGGDIVEELNELSSAAQRFYGLLCRAADEVWRQTAECTEEQVTFDCEKFSAQPKPVKVEMVRRALAMLGGGERNLAQGHFEKVLCLAETKTNGREIDLPGGITARRETRKILFVRRRVVPEPEKLTEEVEIAVPGQTRFGNWLVKAKLLNFSEEAFAEFKAAKTEFVEWFDFDKLCLPLKVRDRAAGDKFLPLGMASEKKVGKFLTAQKVLREVREKILVVEDREKIIWAWPVRMSEQVKISGQTKRILQLTIGRSEV